MYPEENGYIYIISRFLFFVNSSDRIFRRNFVLFLSVFIPIYTKGLFYDPKYVTPH